MEYLVKKTEITKYLEDYHSGKIKLGYGINNPLDEYLRAKHGQLNIINGIDNVGKTVWILWYFLQLSIVHNLKWVIYSGENKTGQLVRQLIQFYSGKYIKSMDLGEVFKHELQINEWFTFVDNKHFYKSSELFKIFNDIDCFGCLIDPFTGLDREFTHAANYEFLNECRAFCNQTGKSIYVNTHVHSEASRRTYGDKSPFTGYVMPPLKSQSEGGQPFANRPDDFITIHRLVGHPHRNTITEAYIRKVKDTETGGKVSPIDAPIEFDFNNGLGFKYVDTRGNQEINNFYEKEDNNFDAPF